MKKSRTNPQRADAVPIDFHRFNQQERRRQAAGMLAFRAKRCMGFAAAAGRRRHQPAMFRAPDADAADASNRLTDIDRGAFDRSQRRGLGRRQACHVAKGGGASGDCPRGDGRFATEDLMASCVRGRGRSSPGPRRACPCDLPKAILRVASGWITVWVRSRSRNGPRGTWPPPRRSSRRRGPITLPCYALSSCPGSAPEASVRSGKLTSPSGRPSKAREGCPRAGFGRPTSCYRRS